MVINLSWKSCAAAGWSTKLAKKGTGWWHRVPRNVETHLCILLLHQLPREHPQVFLSRAGRVWSAPTKALMRHLWAFLCCHSFGFCPLCWLMLLQQSRDRLWWQMGKYHSWQTKKKRGKNSISVLLNALVCQTAPGNTELFYHEPLRAALRQQHSKRNTFICSAEKNLYFTAMPHQLIRDLTIFWEIKLNVCQEKRGQGLSSAMKDFIIF